MITAKDAFAKTQELIQKDADELDARCQLFIDNSVNTKVIKAIEDRQLYCGFEIPKELKQATAIIQKKLEALGYGVAVTHGYVNCITLGWNNCK